MSVGLRQRTAGPLPVVSTLASSLFFTALDAGKLRAIIGSRSKISFIFLDIGTSAGPNMRRRCLTCKENARRLLVRLLIQPGDGVMPLVRGSNGAKRSVEIVIFRFDRSEIERALANAVKRGVFVHALIAHIKRFGEGNLRKLEMQLLAAGVTVARTADDLARYHGKLMIIDRRELYLFAFNFTYVDIERSRSFGIITSNRKLVHEAARLFEADSKRHLYEPGLSALVVSPANARKQIASFIKDAKTELLIYDPTISDPVMIRLLEERVRAGVDIKIIGRLTQRSARLKVHKLH